MTFLSKSILLRTCSLFLGLMFFTFALSARVSGQIYINEIMASNATVHADVDFGNYTDWIELYNSSDVSIDLSTYFLSEDSLNLSMWNFPMGTAIQAKGYLLVYADGTGNGLHTNFSLSKEGEQIMLVNGQSQIVQTIVFPYQMTDVSYGRESDDLQRLGFFESPTPGGVNSDQATDSISALPVYSILGGFYTGAQSLEISSSNPAATIYYTLDGTDPKESSLQYSAPISLLTTTVVRAKTFEAGTIPGLTATHSYFINEPQNLPVISLVTDPDHFFSDETGIYVEGTAGVSGYCTSVPHNVNQDWERPVNIELFEKDGTIGLNQVVGAKIFGGCSRVRYPIKSLGLYARKEYETSAFSYRLFPDKESVEYETFIIRAGADDQPFTLLREPLTHMLVKDVIDVDMQAYRPVVLYINGAYWGIHNMREKINEHYPNDNYGLSPDSIDMVKRNPEDSWNVISGSADHYNAMMDYIRSNDITQNVHYNYVSAQMDMDEYINYQIIQIFFGGRDWPGNNIKFWRSREAPYNKWRWILYDLDHMFKEYSSDIMDEATELDCGCGWPNPPWSTYLFRTLLENEEFKHEFIQRFSIYSDSYFSRERIHTFINEMEAVLAPEIPRHAARWGGQKVDLPDNTWMSPIFGSLEKWRSNVQVMRDFTDRRHEMALKHVQDYFGLSGLYGFEAAAIPGNAGIVKIGSVELSDSIFRSDFSAGEVLDISAIANDGYLLSHWKISHYAAKDSALINLGDHWKYYASFDPPVGDWKTIDFDDSLWESGDAELGYGDGDEATVISYGGDSNNKIITTLFRKKFTIEDAGMVRRFTVHLLRDDGAKIYLNGNEVIRDNMQRWSTGLNATAEMAVSGADEQIFHTLHINPEFFINGENVMAVEIHQASAGSSDISFDMELLTVGEGDGTSEISYEQQVQIALSGMVKVEVVFIADTSNFENVFINEIMTLNLDKYPDEFGEYEDWIELYNAGSDPVDMAGVYLSDSIPATKPWRIPKGYPDLTMIMPGDYLVVYADNQIEQGILHAGFRLSGLGEEVALFKILGEDTTMIDHVVFNEQYGNVAWGRYPDGSDNWEYMPVITPWAANFWEPLDTTSVALSRFMAEVNVYPVPTEGPLFIKFNETIANSDLPLEIYIYSMTGRLVSMTKHRSSEMIELSLTDDPAGLYLVQIRVGEDVFEKRIIVL